LLNNSAETGVSCSGCTECCKSNQILQLHPDQGDEVNSYHFQTVIDKTSGETIYALAADDRGRCVYLGVDGCTIYARRPLLCRSFDCRKHYLILPKQDRDNLVSLGLSARPVFNAGRARLKSLSPAERKQCLETRQEFFPEL
jgi:Fe-S-cluster containining protein